MEFEKLIEQKNKEIEDLERKQEEQYSKNKKLVEKKIGKNNTWSEPVFIPLRMLFMTASFFPFIFNWEYSWLGYISVPLVWIWCIYSFAKDVKYENKFHREMEALK